MEVKHFQMNYNAPCGHDPEEISSSKDTWSRMAV